MSSNVSGSLLMLPTSSPFYATRTTSRVVYVGPHEICQEPRELETRQSFAFPDTLAANVNAESERAETKTGDE